MSFIKDVFGRNRRNNGDTNNANSESGQDAQTGTTASQPTQDLNRNRSGSGQVRSGAAAAVVDQQGTSGQSDTQASQSQGTTQPQPQPRQGQGAAQPAQQGLATAQPPQASPVAAQPTLGDPSLAQRLVAQALQGNAVYFGVLPDGRGDYAYMGFSSELELQAAVQCYSGQFAAQQAAGFSTGHFSEGVIIHNELSLLSNKLNENQRRGDSLPETDHLRVVRIWEDTVTGAQYASSDNIPANVRNVRMRLAVTRKGDNACILGYL